MNFKPAVMALLIAVSPAAAAADVLLEESGEFGPQPTSEVREFTFEITETGNSLSAEATVELSQGTVTVRVTNPQDQKIMEAGAQSMRLGPKTIENADQLGPYRVEVVPEEAVGTWSVKIATAAEITPLGELWPFVSTAVSGIGMILVGLVAVLVWRHRSHAQWRWFWVGAAVWTVGVFLKFAWAIPTNKPIIGWLKASLPEPLYLTVGSIYIGALTGVFEIGITLVAALIWRQMARSSDRGVAVGVGAGAFEAILLGLVPAIFALVAFAVGGDLRNQLISGVNNTALATPALWLIGPAERVIAVLCHTASRALVLLGVAQGKWLWPFAAGFFIMTAIDAIAGYVHLAGMVGKVNTWWIELALAPAAIASVPITVWCIRRWPEPAADVAAQHQES